MIEWIFSASPRLRENIGFSPTETPVLSRRRGGAEECRTIRFSGYSVSQCLRERNALLIFSRNPNLARGHGGMGNAGRT
jgi:hypothetical protein